MFPRIFRARHSPLALPKSGEISAVAAEMDVVAFAANASRIEAKGLPLTFHFGADLEKSQLE